MEEDHESATKVLAAAVPDLVQIEVERLERGVVLQAKKSDRHAGCVRRKYGRVVEKRETESEREQDLQSLGQVLAATIPDLVGIEIELPERPIALQQQENQIVTQGRVCDIWKRRVYREGTSTPRARC